MCGDLKTFSLLCIVEPENGKNAYKFNIFLLTFIK